MCPVQCLRLIPGPLFASAGWRADWDISSIWLAHDNRANPLSRKSSAVQTARLDQSPTPIRSVIPKIVLLSPEEKEMRMMQQSVCRLKKFASSAAAVSTSDTRSFSWSVGSSVPSTMMSGALIDCESIHIGPDFVVIQQVVLLIHPLHLILSCPFTQSTLVFILFLLPFANDANSVWQSLVSSGRTFLCRRFGSKLITQQRCPLLAFSRNHSLFKWELVATSSWLQNKSNPFVSGR